MHSPEIRARAIDKSIAKWLKNSEAQEYSDIVVGVENCPLCDLYFKAGCEGCPIVQVTGKVQCRNTPLNVLEPALVAFCEGDKSHFHQVSGEMAALLSYIREVESGFCQG
jgi:predicted secreted protein